MEDTKTPWLREQISRGDAEDMLTLDGLTDGLFLIRQSSRNRDDYVLVLVFDRRIYHYLIRKQDSKYHCAQGPPFDNLDDLVRYFRQHDDGLYTYLLRPCTVQSCSASGLTTMAVSIDQDDRQTAGDARRDSDSEQAPAANQGGIFDRLKCFTEVSDDGMRQTFIVQMMGRRDVSEGLQYVKQNITSIISKIASKGKRKPVILMASGEGLKVLDSKRKTIVVRCSGEDVICCMQSGSKPKHFAAILSSPEVAAGELKFTILAFKNHLGSVSSVEDIASLVTGLIERHATLVKDDSLRDIGIQPVSPVSVFSNSSAIDRASPSEPRLASRLDVPSDISNHSGHVSEPTRSRLSPVSRRNLFKKQEAVDRPPAPLPFETKSDVIYQNATVRRSSLPVESLTATSRSTDDDSFGKIPHDDTTRNPRGSTGTDDVQYVNVPVRSPRPRIKMPRALSEDVTARSVELARRTVLSPPSQEELDAVTASLASGWRAYWSDRESRMFYYNSEKKLSSWKKPKTLCSDS